MWEYLLWYASFVWILSFFVGLVMAALSINAADDPSISMYWATKHGDFVRSATEREAYEHQHGEGSYQANRTFSQMFYAVLGGAVLLVFPSLVVSGYSWAAPYTVEAGFFRFPTLLCALVTAAAFVLALRVWYGALHAENLTKALDRAYLNTTGQMRWAFKDRAGRLQNLARAQSSASLFAHRFGSVEIILAALLLAACIFTFSAGCVKTGAPRFGVLPYAPGVLAAACVGWDGIGRALLKRKVAKVNEQEKKQPQ